MPNESWSRLPRGNAGWLPSGVIVAVLALVLLLSLGGTAAASPGEELWRSRSGDDPRWASPGFDDSDWRQV
ncbi:MAG TPA: hypothetical protein VKK31_26575, partial [Thermoanaerobaculia bacterium]|nr:hypothetical protein [Thermoanaerobaculia bacterium]